ncbi:PepSY-like domain-containing protein [Empedobacter falsenii]
MKIFFLATITVVSIAFTVTSCSSDDDNNHKTIIQVSELPLQANNFIETYFVTATVAKVEKDIRSLDEFYEVRLADGTQIDFNETGIWTEVDGKNKSIPTQFINENIVKYVITNYTTTTIEGIDKKTYGFDVDLVNNTELRFDINGKFLGFDN